jgi:hypothetical protein
VCITAAADISALVAYLFHTVASMLLVLLLLQVASKRGGMARCAATTVGTLNACLFPFSSLLPPLLPPC